MDVVGRLVKATAGIGRQHRRQTSIAEVARQRRQKRLAPLVEVEFTIGSSVRAMIGQRYIVPQGAMPKSGIESRPQRRDQVRAQALGFAGTTQSIQQIGCIFVSLNHLTGLSRVLALDAAQVCHRIDQVGEKVSILPKLGIIGIVKILQGVERSVKGPLQRLDVSQIAGDAIHAGQGTDELGGRVGVRELPEDRSTPVRHKVKSVHNVARVPAWRGWVTAVIRFPPVLTLTASRVLILGELDEHVLKSRDPGIGQQLRHGHRRRQGVWRIDHGLVHGVHLTVRIDQVGIEQI